MARLTVVSSIITTNVAKTMPCLPAMTGSGKFIPPIKMVNYCMIFYGHEWESFFGNIYGISMDDWGMVNMALIYPHYSNYQPLLTVISQYINHH